MQLKDKKYSKKVIIVDEKSTPEARAERLRRIRNIANLSREQMCGGDKLNINTYKGWEIARYGGLPVDGAERVINRVACEGVICTTDWLLYGKGIGPYIMPDNLQALPAAKQSEISSALHDDDQLIMQEVAVFRSHYPEVISCKIADDGLSPQYAPGDYVAGVRRYGAHLNGLLGSSCIVQVESGDILVRYIRQGDFPGKYHLMCVNTQTTVLQPVLYNVIIISAAPILRHYRRNCFSKVFK